MSSWLAVALSVPALKKRESVLEPFKRTAKLVDEEHEKALLELQCATQELVQEIEKKVS